MIGLLKAFILLIYTAVSKRAINYVPFPAFFLNTASFLHGTSARNAVPQNTLWKTIWQTTADLRKLNNCHV